MVLGELSISLLQRQPPHLQDRTIRSVKGREQQMGIWGARTRMSFQNLNNLLAL